LNKIIAIFRVVMKVAAFVMLEVVPFARTMWAGTQKVQGKPVKPGWPYDKPREADGAETKHP